MFRGRVYGDRDRRYSDGHFVYTAYVESITDRGDYYLVKTISCQWMLFKKHANLEKGNINV